MNLDLTDVQAAQWREHEACVVPLLLPTDLVPRTKQIMYENGIPQGSDDPIVQAMGAPPLGPITDPPGRVVPQPWLDATGPCETCGGLGWVVEGQTIGWPAGDQVQCGDCRNGHPIVELRAPCLHTSLTGVDSGPGCLDCLDRNWVSLGRYTVKLHLVVTSEAYGVGTVSVFRDGEHVEPGEHVGLYLSDRWEWYSFDPLPVPGRDMVAVLAKEEG
jgi:hypothetical protein